MGGETTSRRPRVRVLIVDDDELFAAAVGGLLTAEGFDVVGRARNGAEGVELAQSLRPDVVVMDIAMPSLDGVQATQLIAQRQPECCVLVVSGSRLRDQIALALGAGAVGYVAKDEVAALADAIRSACAGDRVLQA